MSLGQMIKLNIIIAAANLLTLAIVGGITVHEHNLTFADWVHQDHSWLYAWMTALNVLTWITVLARAWEVKKRPTLTLPPDAK